MARRWLLVVVAVVAVLIWILGRPRLSNAITLAPASTAASDGRIPAVAAAPMPNELTRASLEPAVRDPFVPVVPPARVIKALPVIPVAEAPPAPPAPPPLDLRFAGRMTAPDGRTMVLVGYRENTLTLTPGLVLPNGYKVEAIERDVVRFSYPSMDAVATLELPQPPRFEVR